MQRTSIMLPPALKHRAEQKARELHLSLGEFLRTAAEEFLERLERPRTADPLAGSDYLIEQPAPPRVSENVDRYLCGKRK